MRSTVNLHILQQEFGSLAESAYFDSGFKEFSSNTLDAIDHVLEDPSQYPDDVVKAFEHHLWNARKFVRGSRASDTPYEVQYALQTALEQWNVPNALISNAELEDISFFLNLSDLWIFIKTTLINFDTKGYEPIVVRIGAPSVYKHRPVFCIPLFHELGHFIDLRYGITSISMVTMKPVGINSSDQHALQREHHHRMEHFADLFAASYCADSLNDILRHLEGSQPATDTHPATTDRAAVVSDFLSGSTNAIVAMFQTILPLRGLPTLSKQYTIPKVTGSFDDVLTYRISSDKEFFGFFPASWQYLEDQIEHRSAPWIRADTTLLGIESTVNDLAEKSLRNFEIRSRWDHVVSP